MEKLYFGERARRRHRRARAKKAVVVLWIVALGAGVPGATAMLDWTDRALGTARPQRVTVYPGAVGSRAVVAKEKKAKLHTAEAKKAATPDPLEATSTTGIIAAAAVEFGLDPGYLLSVASCESGLNPTAYNPAGYHGLFQFDQTTWSAYGYG
ncbi:MAG: transglycosylase family protein, partial [Actinobacteria bacterium]|nr:transglycosylase family protein [Actinomycetota bacterium]